LAVNPDIKVMTDEIRNQPDADKVRKNIANGMDATSNIADISNQISEDSKATSLAIQERYEEQILAQDLNPNKDPELVDLRGGKATAGERITQFEQQTNSQLAHNVNNLNTREINVMYPPIPMAGAKGNNIENDTLAFVGCIDYLKENGGGVLRVPAAIYKVDPDQLILGNSVILKGAGKGRWGEMFGSILFFSSYAGEQALFGIQVAYNKIGQGLEDIRLIGNKSISRGLMVSDGSYNNTFRNIDIKGFSDSVYIGETWNNIWEKVTVDDFINGFRIEGTNTSSTFSGCLSYNGDTGFKINSSMPYCGFINCGTDHSSTGVEISTEANVSNTGFYNFGFEDYDICWKVDSETTLNIYGFSQYKPRFSGRLFYIFKNKRINLHGCDFTKLKVGTRLFEISNLTTFKVGSLRSYGCQFQEGVSETLNLDKVVQDGNLPYGYLKKTLIKEKTIRYDGYVEGISFNYRANVPNNGDYVRLNIDILGGASGGTASTTIKNVNGVITATNNIVPNVSFASWAVTIPSGRGGTVTPTEYSFYKVEAFAYGTGELASITQLKIAPEY